MNAYTTSLSFSESLSAQRSVPRSRNTSYVVRDGNIVYPASGAYKCACLSSKFDHASPALSRLQAIRPSQLPRLRSDITEEKPDLRKHSVTISSSFVPLQMGKLYSKQNCLLQSLQVPVFRDAGVVPASPPAGSRPLRGMMVLLVLQIHLQKDVGAGLWLDT